MPPKNKGATRKKSANASQPTRISGFIKEELSEEQIEEHIAHRQEEMDREMEERKYFQLERDNVNNFWEITKRKLDEVNSEISVLEKATEDDEGRHRVEIKVYKQKTKHLLCEHQSTISELKADHLLSAEAIQKENDHLEAELQERMKAIMVDIHDFDNKTSIRELEQEQAKEMAAAREDWERRLAEIVARNEASFQRLQQELESIKKSVTSEQQLHWNRHTISLKEDHNQALRDCQAAVVFEEEWANIDQLKQECEEKQMNQREKEKVLGSQQHDNQLLTERVSELKSQIAKLERKTKYTNDMKISAHLTKKDALKNLKTDYKVLEQRFSKLQLEQDELYKSVTQNIQSVQNKTDHVNSLLESKLKTLTDNLEKTQAQLHSVLSAPNLDHIALSEVTNKVKRNIVSRNSAIKDLEFKRFLISKARRDLLLAFKTKQRAFVFSRMKSHHEMLSRAWISE